MGRLYICMLFAPEKKTNKSKKGVQTRDEGGRRQWRDEP